MIRERPHVICREWIHARVHLFNLSDMAAFSLQSYFQKSGSSGNLEKAVMATAHGRKLACDLILTHFGDIVHKVCRCLVHGGPLSIGDIGRLAELNLLEVESSIVVLLQHNCVQGFKAQEEDGSAGENPSAIATLPPQVSTSYIVICDNILHRMRFPKFVVMVRDDLGEEAEILIEELLEHGRLTLEQIIQRGAAVAGKDPQAVTKELKETFEVLLQSHYVERCPSSEPVLPWTGAPESPQKVQQAAALSIERFQMPTSTDDLADSAMDKEVDETFNVSQTVTTKALHMDAETSATITEKDILWRVNFEEFVRRLRHQACVRLVQSRVDIGAGVVLAAMLNATWMQESSAKEQYSGPLSMDSIVESVQLSPRGQHMTLERIQEIVQQLEADSSGYFSRSCESSRPMERDNSYVINMRKIVELCQRIEVERIILQHFGRDCCRIFQLLAAKGQLEQKQIGERAMVPINVEELLHRLLKDQYVQVQEIAKLSEQTTRKSKYFWRVNYKGVQHRVLDDLYWAAASICSRLADEHNKEQEVLGFTHQVQEIANEDAHAQVPGTPEEQVKDNHQFTTILENSLSKVDDAILLFHDF